MSFRALIIPEDPTHNGAILRPLFQRLLSAAGRRNAKIEVFQDPDYRGYESLLRGLDQIAIRFSHFDLLVLVVDRDGRVGRPKTLGVRAKRARSGGANFVPCIAIEEVEIWLLAGHLSKLGVPWKVLRADASVKENHFGPFLAKYGDDTKKDGGREELMLEALKNLQGILGKCEELNEFVELVRNG